MGERLEGGAGRDGAPDAQRERLAGWAAHQAGDLAAAERAYGAALAVDPADSETRHLLGVVRYQQGDAAVALVLIDEAIAATPGVARMHCNRAECLRSLGRLAEAEAACRQALALQPDYPEALLNLAVAAYAQDHWSVAEAAADQALARRPDWVPALLARADALRGAERWAEAEAAYRRVLAREARNGGALINLGLMLVHGGQMDEGLALARQGAALEGGAGADGALVESLGRVLLEHGRLDELMALLEEALVRHPDAPGLNLLVGLAWHELGEMDEALNWLSRASQLNPEGSSARVALASVVSDLEDKATALALLDDLLAEHPGQIEALALRARVRLDLGDVAGAVGDYRAALALRPDSARLRAALGGTLASAGDLDGAVALQREALALNGECVAAHAGLLTTLRHRVSPGERKAAEDLLQAPWMTDQRRAALHFGLAASYDGEGDWATAAHHMVAANHHAQAVNVATCRRYDTQAYAALVERVVETFTPDLFAALHGLGSTDARPVFIVGMPRSGTTLTEQILASHPAVWGAGERSFARQGFTQLSRQPGLPGQTEADPLIVLGELATRPAPVATQALAASAQWHLAQLQGLLPPTASGEGILRVVDKMPDNYLLLGWLALLFPKARFIHCRRDLRDVALSCWITNFSAIRWANDLDDIAGRLAGYRRILAHWEKVLPVPLLTVDYESLVANQEAESRRLVAGLGLPWDDRCLRYHETERLVRTASVAQVRQPIYRRSVARWTHYTGMLAPLLAQLEEDEVLR